MLSAILPCKQLAQTTTWEKGVLMTLESHTEAHKQQRSTHFCPSLLRAALPWLRHACCCHGRRGSEGRQAASNTSWPNLSGSHAECTAMLTATLQKSTQAGSAGAELPRLLPSFLSSRLWALPGSCGGAGQISAHGIQLCCRWIPDC